MLHQPRAHGVERRSDVSGASSATTSSTTCLQNSSKGSSSAGAPAASSSVPRTLNHALRRVRSGALRRNVAKRPAAAAARESRRVPPRGSSWRRLLGGAVEHRLHGGGRRLLRRRHEHPQRGALSRVLDRGGHRGGARHRRQQADYEHQLIPASTRSARRRSSIDVRRERPRTVKSVGVAAIDIRVGGRDHARARLAARGGGRRERGGLLDLVGGAISRCWSAMSKAKVPQVDALRRELVREDRRPAVRGAGYARGPSPARRARGGAAPCGTCRGSARSWRRMG